MNRIACFWAICIAIVFNGSLFASADEPSFDRQTRLSAVGGLNLTTLTSNSDASNPNPSFGPGPSLGALVSFDIDPDFEIETGLIYSREKIDFSLIFSSSYSSSFSDVQIPLVIRYHLSPHLSAGGGLYYGTIVGQVQSTADIYTGVPSSGFTHGDFGAIFNARGNMPISQNVDAILDLRYLLGVQDFGPFGSAQNRAMQILVGASFTL